MSSLCHDARYVIFCLLRSACVLRVVILLAQKGVKHEKQMNTERNKHRPSKEVQHHALSQFWHQTIHPMHTLTCTSTTG